MLTLARFSRGEYAIKEVPVCLLGLENFVIGRRYIGHGEHAEGSVGPFLQFPDESNEVVVGLQRFTGLNERLTDFFGWKREFCANSAIAGCLGLVLG